MESKAKSKVVRRPIVIRGLDSDLVKLLISRGVPPQDMPTKSIKIDVENALVKIEPDIPNIQAKAVSVSKQYKLLESFIEHPLRSSQTVCISSFPSDLRAKYLAIQIMSVAITHHRLGLHKPGRSLPIWHRVYGGFGDSLRDKPTQDIPSLLIITNVNVNSGQVKLEKVRDLIEKYSEIPKIIVTGGEPPCNLFANKLHSPLRVGLYLGPDNRIREI